MVRQKTLLDVIAIIRVIVIVVTLAALPLSVVGKFHKTPFGFSKPNSIDIDIGIVLDVVEYGQVLSMVFKARNKPIKLQRSGSCSSLFA
jgi:hypothetical protein